ncbi:MAG: hypothetical protein U9Q81_17325 [Pseudomonadota bacterium]|nr:hypothetical protein [Pseudomonadota bacterium]
MSRRQKRIPESLLEIAVSDEEESELVVGRELAALIRDEHQDEPAAPLVVLPPRPSDQQPTRGPENRRRRKIPVRRIADAAGILIALTTIFVAYRWFSDLPEKPADSPWALLGSGRSDAGGDHPANGLKGTTPGASDVGAAGTEPPLGQFDFGPDDLPVSAADERPASQQTVERHRSIHELEAAFDARYVPPPECYDWGSTARMATCGNHRIRARRAFIDSGGRLTPAMFGSTALPQPETEPYRLEMRGREPEQDWRKSWLQESSQDQEQDWRREWLQDPRQGAVQDWPQE